MFHKKSWLQRRTGLERVLLCVLGACGAAALVTGEVVVLRNKAREPGAGAARSAQEDICLTSDCAVAGRERSQIMQNCSNCHWLVLLSVVELSGV